MKVNIPVAEKTNWLVIFLVLDTNDLLKFLSNFFVKLSNVKLEQSTKIYFLKDTASRIVKPDRYGFHLELHEIIFDEIQGKTVMSPVTIEDVKLEEGNAWLEVIRQVYTATAAKFNTLITWSHGAGLSIANATPPHIKAKENDYVLIRNPEQRYESFVPANVSSRKVIEYENAISVERNIHETDCPQLEQLFISEIGRGLKDIIPGKKFDIVIMCNCKTHLIDNCYNLAAVTNYYFAPLGDVQLDGFDFANLIDFINKPFPEDIDVKTYLGQIISELFTGYKQLAATTFESEAIVVNNLDRIPEMRNLLNPICSYIRTNKAVFFPMIIQILGSKISPVPDSDVFDIITFFREIKKETNPKEAEFISLLENFESFVLTVLFVDKMIGKDLQAIQPPIGLESFGVYIPPNVKEDVIPKSIVCQYLKSYLKAPFVVETEWDNLIGDFIMWQVNNGIYNTYPGKSI